MAWEPGDLKNRHKYLLQYHLFSSANIGRNYWFLRQISDDIKQFSYEICQRHSVIIRYMETDKDHIHYMIETEPTMSISKIKPDEELIQHTIYGKDIPNIYGKQFWKEHTFGRDGYFARSGKCIRGNAEKSI